MASDSRYGRLALPLLGNVVQGVVWGVFFSVLLPSYAALHGHLDSYGMVVASNAAAMALFSIPGGRLSDVLGRRRVILVGWSILAIAPFLLWGRTDFLPMILAAVVSGVGLGTSSSAFYSYIADVSFKRRMSSNFAALASVSLACAALVMFVMGRWLDRFISPQEGLDMGFAIMGGLMVLGAIASIGFRKMEVQTRPPRLRLFGLHESFTPKEWRIVKDMIILQSVIGVGAALTVQFYVPFFIDKFGVGQGSLFMLSAVGTAVLSVSTLISGAAGDRTNKLTFILASNCLAVPMAFGILLSPIFEVAGLFYVTRMALANMIWPVWTAFFMVNLKPNVRGLANGVSAAAWNLTYIPSAFFAWRIMKFTGGWSIPLSSVMYVCVTSYVVWHLGDIGRSERDDRRRERDEEKEQKRMKR